MLCCAALTLTAAQERTTSPLCGGVTRAGPRRTRDLEGGVAARPRAPAPAGHRWGATMGQDGLHQGAAVSKGCAGLPAALSSFGHVHPVPRPSSGAAVGIIGFMGTIWNIAWGLHHLRRPSGILLWGLLGPHGGLRGGHVRGRFRGCVRGPGHRPRLCLTARCLVVELFCIGSVVEVGPPIHLCCRSCCGGQPPPPPPTPFVDAAKEGRRATGPRELLSVIDYFLGTKPAAPHVPLSACSRLYVCELQLK